MIRHETLPQPQPVFVRAFTFSSCMGHGLAVARRVFDRPGSSVPTGVIYLDVQMPDGSLRTVTPDMVCDPTNVAARTIAPAPLRIPAPPAGRARL